MAMHVALLRGVNVGKANRVPMADWRALLERIGCRNVVTLLNSGNAVFVANRQAPAKLAARISERLAQEMGVDVPVIVKTAAQFAVIVADNPFAKSVADPSRLLVAFAQETAALRALAPIAALATPPDHFHLGAAAAYLHCPDGIFTSKAAAGLLGKAGRGATSRNWSTTLKLQALLSSGAQGS